MADNFSFDITGVPLDKSLAVATHNNNKVVAWRIDKDGKRLILYWAEHESATKLPAPLGGDAVETFVRSWLESVDYGQRPDIDGSTARGWRIYNEYWGHIDHQWQAFVAIEPTWLEYGK